MKQETARDLLIPYLDGELDPQTRKLLESHLAGDPALQTELEQLRTLFDTIERAPAIEPDAGMRQRFAGLLEEEQERAPAAASSLRRDGFQLLSFPTILGIAAAAVFLLAGTGLGWWIARHNPATDPAVPPTVATNEIDELRRDVELLRSLLVRAPQAGGSASFRLQTMNLAGEADSLDSNVADALFRTLREDESPNVRLAALEALSRFKDQPDIRQRLAGALRQQDDAFVQIGLIRVLTESGSPEARESIEELLLRPDVPAVVKGFAQQGLTRL
jgi:hypothetical protein